MNIAASETDVDDMSSTDAAVPVSWEPIVGSRMTNGIRHMTQIVDRKGVGRVAKYKKVPGTIQTA